MSKVQQIFCADRIVKKQKFSAGLFVFKRKKGFAFLFIVFFKKTFSFTRFFQEIQNF